MAVAYLVVAVAAGVPSVHPLELALVAMSITALFIGYSRRIPMSTAAAGLLLYYPLALAFGHLAPGGWAYVASAVVLIPLSERLSFEYRMSVAQRAPRGMDEESRALSDGLSRSHGVRLFWFVGAAAAVAALSLAVSALANYWVLLVAGSVMLLFALWWYGRR